MAYPYNLSQPSWWGVQYSGCKGQRAVYIYHQNKGKIKTLLIWQHNYGKMQHTFDPRKKQNKKKQFVMPLYGFQNLSPIHLHKGLFTIYISQNEGIYTPVPPFFSHFQHFPNPPPPFCHPMSAFHPPSSFCRISFVSIFNNTLFMKNQLKKIVIKISICYNKFLEIAFQAIQRHFVK